VPESRVEERWRPGSAREKNSETGYRFELRAACPNAERQRRLFQQKAHRFGLDNLSHARPTSQPSQRAHTYLINNLLRGNPAMARTFRLPILGLNANTPFPLSMADVQRDKWKVSVDWTAFDRLNVQLMAEDGKGQEQTTPIRWPGARAARQRRLVLRVDVSFVLSDAWSCRVMPRANRPTISTQHRLCGDSTIQRRHGLALDPAGEQQTAGGANLTYINDVNKYGIAAAPHRGKTARPD